MMHQAHQQRFMDAMQGGLAVLTAFDEVQGAGDMAAPFIQESNFWWLTGIEQAGWKVIIDSSRRSLLLVRPMRSDAQRLFDGDMSDDEAIKVSGAQGVIAEAELEAYLRRLARQHTVVQTVYDQREYDFVSNPAQHDLHSQLGRIFSSVQDCRQVLDTLRAIKSEGEIAAIRKAIALTITSFEAIRKQLESYRYEYEIEADMTRVFRRANAQHAYRPIVASGSRAVTLHYIANGARLAKRQPLLVDVGARVDGYAADITRTYCLKPTKRQQQVHAAVENAHRRIIALLGPNLLVAEYIHQVDEIMKDALVELGLLEDRNDTKTYRNYFPHAISHGLGIDVHDSLGAPRYFQPGMVLTVEPGIYIEEEHIGVRIEDDILITADGHENLSRALSTSL
ncbi:MAG: aminopeptidase P N-terminal domain-containing protein [Candidatus Saccharimonas aalborgensis]